MVGWGSFFGELLSIRYGKMGREEQIEEREVLDSIFPDEITGASFSENLIMSRVCVR